MKIREEKWLESLVREWAEKGLIRSAQADAILQDRQAKREKPGISLAVILSALGGLFVALGIVLVISFNWEHIPRFWKMGVYLVLLAAVAEGLRRVPEKLKVGRAALHVGWLLLPLAGIGLWAQIYQLSGDPFKPFLITLLLGLVLLLKSRSLAVAILYVLLIYAALFTGTFQRGSGLIDLGIGWNRTSELGAHHLLAFGIITVFLAGGILIAKKRFESGLRYWTWLVTLGYLFSLGVDRTVLAGRSDGSMGLLLAALVMLFWGGRELLDLEPHPWEGWGVLFVSVYFYSLTFFWSDHAFHAKAISTAAASYLAILGVAGFVLLVLTRLDGIYSGVTASWIAKGFVAGPAFLTIPMFFDTPYKVVALLANVGLAGFALFLLVEGVKMNRPKRINHAVGLMVILIITRFIHYYGSLLESGVAFIVTGVVIVGLSLAANAGRKRLLEIAGSGRRK